MSRLSSAFKRSNREVRTPSTGDRLQTEKAPSPGLEYRQSNGPSSRAIGEATGERTLAPAAARKSSLSERRGSLGSLAGSLAATPAAAAASESAISRRGSVASRASSRLAPSTFKRTDSEDWKVEIHDLAMLNVALSANEDDTRPDN
eukprot:3832153-Pleurochrysis_carterae.AAC.2